MSILIGVMLGASVTAVLVFFFLLPSLNGDKKPPRRNPVMQQSDYPRYFGPGRMTFKDLSVANRSRCLRWHPPESDDWTIGDWGNALAGEVGELCNVLKKIRRHQSGVISTYNTPELQDLQEMAMEEAADVLLYWDLLLAKLEVPPEVFEHALCDKFNRVSLVQEFPERVHPHTSTAIDVDAYEGEPDD